MRGKGKLDRLVCMWVTLITLALGPESATGDAGERVHQMSSVSEMILPEPQLRTLKSNKADNQSRYEWGRGYDVNLEPGSMKAICFDKGSTICVQYTYLSTTPVLAFVADRKWTATALKGAQKIRYISDSVCSGINCADMHVAVPRTTSYCVLFINRNNTIPEFSYASDTHVRLQFMVAGCTGAANGILYVIVLLVLVLALMGCCLGAIFHIRKLRSIALQNRNITRARMGLGDQNYVTATQTVDGCKVVFMEAKV